MKNLVDEVVQTNRDTAYTFLLDERGSPGRPHLHRRFFRTALLGVNTVRDGETHGIRLLPTDRKTSTTISPPRYTSAGPASAPPGSGCP
ncbi:MAG: hypothetical protein MZU95_12510 [Desulfomicrobium escambiense]|nr:hypothetical protein [Desulfomicrobium escambiense]